MHKHELIQRLFLLAVLTAFSFSCKSSPTGPHIGQNLQLSSDYVTCTEVWLKLAYSGQPSAVSGGEFKITRDGDTVLTGNLTSLDTTVIDTTAQPEQAYTYRAYRYFRNQVSDTSLAIQVTTMDTTSNNFTWQTYTFGGDAGSCILKDVAIINDTDIWAVGEIPIKDSSANGYSVYNLVQWDGNGWRLAQVESYTFCGQSNMGVYSAYSVLPWSKEDVWIATAGELVRWIGDSQSTPVCIQSGTPFDILRMWGEDSTHVFAVGRAGGMLTYDGYVWGSLSSSTKLDIDDIWGISDSTTGQQEILAVASDQFTNNGVAVLQLSSTQVTSLQTAGLPTTSIVGVWSANGKEWYVCGDGLYKSRDLNRPWQQIVSVPLVYTEAIRGTGPNDIFVVGDGVVLHFNGSTWFNCRSQISASSVQLYAVAVKGKTIVAVGQTLSGIVGGPALILVGKRN